MGTIDLTITIISLLVALWFGVRSMFQSQDLEALQTALRAYNQGLFNNIWRMGANAEDALKAADLAEAQQLARGIADMSQTTRHTLIAFSREHARFVPRQEAAWNPLPLEAERPRSLWRKLFRI